MELDRLKRAFEQFRKECIWLRRCYNSHSTLFDGGDEVNEVLMSTAGNFFHDLSIILQEYILQRICALTDPPRTGANENLTFRFINEGLEEHNLLTTSITKLSERIHNYRSLIIEARNKGLSHFDLAFSLSGKTLGEHTVEEVERFYMDLQLYNDEVAEVLVCSPLDFRATPAEGDAIDLISFLLERSKK